MARRPPSEDIDESRLSVQPPKDWAAGVPLDSTAEISNTPTSKSIMIRLEPV